jgi:hypothetical protein
MFHSPKARRLAFSQSQGLKRKLFESKNLHLLPSHRKAALNYSQLLERRTARPIPSRPRMILRYQFGIIKFFNKLAHDATAMRNGYYEFFSKL